VAELEDHAALVIGASRGMGKQMAIELARLGADVAVAARTALASDSDLPGTTGATADEIRAFGRRAEPIRVDLVNGADIDGMVARAIELLGHIDIGVHSVQYHGHGMYDPFVDTSIEELEEQMWVNAMSAVRVCKLLVPHMAERGGGTIVLVTSSAGRIDHGQLPGTGAPGLGYDISKAAICRLVSALAKEVKDAGIAVIGLSPGFVLSEFVQEGAVDGAFMSWDTSRAVPPTLPAKAVGWLCTNDPMSHTGIEYELSDLVAAHDLA
jgi:NAD(P)-dependent dehydrogenase (short-subunit alcohol dehydrogenase family)